MPARLIKIDDVSPGMKLAKDVADARGNLLFKTGVELSPPMIERVRARNVSHVFVEDTGGPGLTEADLDAKKGALDSEMDAMFADVAQQPLMVELRESAKRYLKSKLGA